MAIINLIAEMELIRAE